MKRRGFLSAIVGLFSAPVAAVIPKPKPDIAAEYCAWARGITMPTKFPRGLLPDDRIVNPPMLVDVGIIEDWPTLRPGSIVYVRRPVDRDADKVLQGMKIDVT